MKELITKVQEYVMRHGRALERARFLHAFANGKAETVLNELRRYQNRDGGFGRELEPDFTTPESNPIDTWTALRIMDGMAIAKDHPLLSSTIAWLENTKHQKDGFFLYTIPSVNDRPHAPWWHHDKDREVAGYNPTAALIGFILKHTEKDHPLHERMCERRKKAIRDFLQNPPKDMHELRSFVELFETTDTLYPAKDFAEALAVQIENCVEKDPDKWFTTYCARPSQLILSTRTPGFEKLKDLVEKEHEELLKRRNEEGVWEIPWKWGSYPGAAEKAETIWKGIVAVENLIRMRDFGILHV